jgi:hypothetical protein
MMPIASRIDTRDLGAFIRFPFELYKGDTLWCPVGSAEIRSWFRGEHPLSPSIEFMPILARRDGRVTGRCAAFVNGRAGQDGRPRGCIGLYECEDDQESSAAMLSAAVSLLAARGCASACAPMDGSIWGHYRFMISAEPTRTFMGEPVNKPWYPGQLEAAGFKPSKTWSSFFLGKSGQDILLASMAANRAKALAAGYSLRNPDPRRLDAELTSIHGMVMEAYAGFADFTPLDAREFKALFRDLSRVWDPSLAFLAVQPDGRDAGFNIVLPDPGRGLRAMRGSSSPLAALRFLISRDPRPDIMDLYLGARPSAVRAGSGIGALLGYAACEAALRAGRGFVMALVADDSTVQARVPRDAEEVHRYALWERSIDGSA